MSDQPGKPEKALGATAPQSLVVKVVRLAAGVGLLLLGATHPWYSHSAWYPLSAVLFGLLLLVVAGPLKGGSVR